MPIYQPPYDTNRTWIGWGTQAWNDIANDHRKLAEVAKLKLTAADKAVVDADIQMRSKIERKRVRIQFLSDEMKRLGTLEILETEPPQGYWPPTNVWTQLGDPEPILTEGDRIMQLIREFSQG